MSVLKWLASPASLSASVTAAPLLIFEAPWKLLWTLLRNFKTAKNPLEELKSIMETDRQTDDIWNSWASFGAKKARSLKWTDKSMKRQIDEQIFWTFLNSSN